LIVGLVPTIGRPTWGFAAVRFLTCSIVGLVLVLAVAFWQFRDRMPPDASLGALRGELRDTLYRGLCAAIFSNLVLGALLVLIVVFGRR
jgi:hypothetical protein